ncbi:catechol 2,3-dioxygenase-like lactoylglutathione lyase family enzyme [Rhizomicrobium palustre]|uniref:Catechol 2,3-dioxygenase-like lactoylglutathione lyase family enzyme n=1 Tax=Rhizomicrobium palustre TaxID=189966 RepID=A0A846N2B0_9PROT|nr:VOC family protein [Rhizomicrobium palustre]NIK90078.1 catechol 2,3-dioxygenase-like lactoylglutathione lyase family enzyme [Rhizomicrobium palustre]
MLHHVSVGVRDVERAAKFYDAVLGALGYSRVMEVLPYGVAYGEDEPVFWVQLPHNQQVATPGNGTHFSFVAYSTEAVDAFYQAAIEAGAEDAGKPGPRPDYTPDYYGAFVYDLDGNKLEATYLPLPDLEVEIDDGVIEVAFADEPDDFEEEDQATPKAAKKKATKNVKKAVKKAPAKAVAKKTAKKAAPKAAKKAVKKTAKKAVKKKVVKVVKVATPKAAKAPKAEKAVKPAKAEKAGKKKDKKDKKSKDKKSKRK